MEKTNGINRKVSRATSTTSRGDDADDAERKRGGSDFAPELEKAAFIYVPELVWEWVSVRADRLWRNRGNPRRTDDGGRATRGTKKDVNLGLAGDDCQIPPRPSVDRDRPDAQKRWPAD